MTTEILPNQTPGRSGQFAAVVASNTRVCDEHYRLTLRVPMFPASRPGQFIQIACRDLVAEDFAEHEIDWTSQSPPKFTGLEFSPLAMLRRPFSLAGRRDTADGVELDIIHRIVGTGTQWMANLEVGHSVSIIGPIGNCFTLPPAGGIALMVGGGVGIPPMIYLAGALGLAEVSGVAFCGATSRRLLALKLHGEPAGDGQPSLCADEFTAHRIPTVISTDDGSCGFRGFVTQALERHLDHLGESAKTHCIIYTCGPEPMMKRVAEIAAGRGIQCQVAVERAMACGMGTCQSCVIRVRKDNPADPPLAGRDWCYRLACTDGPVFKGTQLLW